MNTNEMFAVVDKITGVMSNAISGVTENMVKPIATELLTEVSRRSAVSACIWGVLAVICIIGTIYWFGRVSKWWGKEYDNDVIGFYIMTMLISVALSVMSFIFAMEYLNAYLAPMLSLLGK